MLHFIIVIVYKMIIIGLQCITELPVLVNVGLHMCHCELLYDIHIMHITTY